MVFNSITIMQNKIEAMHKDLLELISNLSDETMSEKSSFVCTPFYPTDTTDLED